MIRESPATTVRKNLGELLNEIQYRRDSILITRGGKPVAALVDLDFHVFFELRFLLTACGTLFRSRSGNHGNGSQRCGKSRQEKAELEEDVKVVLDTNVLLSGLMKPDGVPGRSVRACHAA